MLYQPKNRAQDLAGRTADCKVGTGTGGSNKRMFKAHQRHTWQDAQRTARLEPGLAAATKVAAPAKSEYLKCSFLWEGGNPVS